MTPSLWEELVIYRHLVGGRLRGQMQYRSSFLLQFVTNFMIFVVEFGVLLMLFNRFPSLGGWSVGEVAFLYAMSMVSFSFGNLFAGGFDGFAGMIRMGTFDRVLVQPVSPLIQVLGSDLQLRRLGRFVLGAAVFVFAVQRTEIDWTAGRVLMIPVIVLSSFVLFMALFSLEGTLSFWAPDGTEAVNAMTYGGTTLASYPMHIYESWLRRFFFFVVPVGFVVYLPSLYILDKPNPLGMPEWTRFLAPVAALLAAAGASALWQLGIRHYRSTGS